MKFTNKPNECVEISDRKIWVSRACAVCTTIIARKNDTESFVLASKRGGGEKENIGKWNLVCGYLDWDENGPEAARREMWEEVGINLDELLAQYKSFDCSYKPWDVNTEPEKDALQNVTLHYGAIIDLVGDDLPKTTSENCEAGEVSEIRWIPIENINRYDWAFNHKDRINGFMSHFIKSNL